MIVGGLILVLTLVRLAVAIVTRRPPAAWTQSAALMSISRAVHGLLYFLVLSMALSGIGVAIATRLPTVVFGGIGALPDTFDGLAPRVLHGLVAKLLMFTIDSGPQVCATGPLGGNREASSADLP